ncbi:hypothetical protein X943_000488 [Babesia divergens]|uniref:Uncharacterized protein n=1 Tax=Babesia divergens TaxID=32595 RepID=A0AAD9GCL7_BABDI|nr:hypothetical protein X943_000488 [Babesia divergens]
MNTYKILNAAALCLLTFAFHGKTASCGFFNWFGSSKKAEKGPKKRGLDLIDELGVRSPKELDDYDLIDGKLIKKSEAAKKRGNTAKQSAPVNSSGASMNPNGSTVMPKANGVPTTSAFVSSDPAQGSSGSASEAHNKGE